MVDWAKTPRLFYADPFIMARVYDFQFPRQKHFVTDITAY